MTLMKRGKRTKEMVGDCDKAGYDVDESAGHYNMHGALYEAESSHPITSGA